MASARLPRPRGQAEARPSRKPVGQHAAAPRDATRCYIGCTGTASPVCPGFVSRGAGSRHRTSARARSARRRQFWVREASTVRRRAPRLMCVLPARLAAAKPQQASAIGISSAPASVAASQSGWSGEHVLNRDHGAKHTTAGKHTAKRTIAGRRSPGIMRVRHTLYQLSYDSVWMKQSTPVPKCIK